MSILCTICARGGSKGVPKKNIRELLGRPLIVYTIEQALNSKMINRVVVSTDSEIIAGIAKQAGAEVPFIRPAHLAAHDAPKLPVVQHAVRYYIDNLNFAPDYVIDLDPTSPLRLNEDIDKCLDLIINDPDCDSVITGYRSNKNPYFNMIEISKDGFVKLSKKTEKLIAGRQDAPVVYAMNASVYAWKTDILFQREDIISGRTKFIEMSDDRSIDIDSEIDFKLVELIMKERRGK
jgi:CMP-N-acetylneuraminic acid synthetase